MDDRRRAFHVVDAFEEELAAYCGSPFAVTVDSCTNALFLSMRFFRDEFVRRPVLLPARTYVGVVQAARNAGFTVGFRDEEWQGSYRLDPLPIVDSAKRLERGMYEAKTLTCLSFQAAKKLPVGRGGAILTDNAKACEWLKAARLDGRTAGADYADNRYQREGWHCYMSPPDAARGLWLLTYLDDDDQGDWTEYPDLSVASWV